MGWDRDSSGWGVGMGKNERLDDGCTRLGMNEHLRRSEADHDGTRLMDGLRKSECEKSSEGHVDDDIDCNFLSLCGETI